MNKDRQKEKQTVSPCCLSCTLGTSDMLTLWAHQTTPLFFAARSRYLRWPSGLDRCHFECSQCACAQPLRMEVGRFESRNGPDCARCAPRNYRQTPLIVIKMAVWTELYERLKRLTTLWLLIRHRWFFRVWKSLLRTLFDSAVASAGFYKSSAAWTHKHRRLIERVGPLQWYVDVAVILDVAAQPREVIQVNGVNFK